MGVGQNEELKRRGPLKFRIPIEDRERWNFGDLIKLGLLDEQGEDLDIIATVRWTDEYDLLDAVEIHCTRPHSVLVHDGEVEFSDLIRITHYPNNPGKDFCYILPAPGSVLQPLL
ncbi:hypothetical protein IKE79_00085 [Candidatus Saccharibacteria bacterium]|nr:hypothetical protein [Candidatus Saccharibacteria bacterium]